MARRETSQNGPLVLLCARCTASCSLKYEFSRSNSACGGENPPGSRQPSARKVLSRGGWRPPSFTASVVASFPGGGAMEAVVFRFF